MTDFLADLALASAAFGAAAFCLVLSRRLARLSQSDEGLGASLATLAAQSGELTAAVEDANAKAAAAADCMTRLEAAVARADDAAHRLELLMAAADAPPPPPDALLKKPDGPIFRRTAPEVA